MKPMKERIHTKLIAMAGVLTDNIIIPGEHQQQGFDKMKASLYDKDGNKYSFKLSLRVIPEGGFDPEDPEVESPEERFDKIENDVAAIRDEIDEIKLRCDDNESNITGILNIINAGE